ncbi:MAG: fluoride efflux transporter FluC, partial [Nocardioides sp.]
MSRPPLTASMLAAVAAGGAAGAVLRWGLDVAVPDGGGFPWTTFAINLSGSFVLALLPVRVAAQRRPLLALALGPGVLGGYTTLSTYAEQARALFADGSEML